MAGQDLTPIYQAAGQEWNVDPLLLQAVAGQESGGTANPDLALSPKGAQGRMQIMPATGQAMGMTDPSDPVQSIYAGAKYLSQQIDKYGTPELGLAAYNAGPGRVDNYLAGKAALPAETVAYVPGIARRYQALAGNQQQPAPDAGSTSTVSSLDDTATANLDTRMAQLRAGSDGQSVSAPIATPSQPSAIPAASGGGVDWFSQARAAALAATGGTSPTSAQPASTPSQAPAGGQAGVAAPGAPADYFAQMKAAAQAAAGAPPAPGGAVTPVSMPGATTPPPSAAQPATGPQAGTGFLGGVENLAEGAGHAALQASHGLYSAIDAGNRALPVPGQTLGGLIDPSKAIPNLNAENAQYAASGVGNTLAGGAGNIVGQTALTLPALGGLGGVATAAGRGIAAGADAVSPALGSAARSVGNLLMGTSSTPSNMLTQAVVRPASLAANGAAQGAVANVLTGDPTNTIGQNLLMGAGTGAVLGPVAAAAGAAGQGVWNALRGAWQPLTTAGRNAIADTVLAKAAQGGPLTADTTTLVPGSLPTLAQATANPGLAGVERAVASVRPNQFTARATSNNDARATQVENITRTPADIATAEASRDATAVPAITGSIANATGPADASPVVSTIDQILASPAGQRDAVTSALGNIRSKLVTPIPFSDRVGTALDAVNQAAASNPGDVGLWGAQQALAAARTSGAQEASTLARLQGTTTSDPAAQAVIDQAAKTLGTSQAVQADPAQLYGIRKAINDSLSPLAANAGSDAQLAANELQQVKTALDNSIEGAAPGFKQGIADYAASSRPIDAMQYLQSKGYTAADGTVTLAKVKGVLDDIAKQTALPGARNAKSVPQTTVDSLQGLYADLLRQNNSRLGMQPGSNTFQNLAVNSAMQGMGAPAAFGAKLLGGVPFVGNTLTGSIGRMYQSQNEPILEAVVNRLMDPNAAAGVLKKAGQIAAARAAGPSGANPLLTVPAVGLTNRLLGY